MRHLHPVQRASGRERKTDARVAHDGHPGAREQTVRAAEARHERRRVEITLLQRVARENPGEPRPKQGEPELHRSALGGNAPQVGDGEALPGSVQTDGGGDEASSQRRVRVRDVEVVDVVSELPVELDPLALAEQVGFVESDEPAHPGPLADRRPEIDVARAPLGDLEDDIDITLLIGRFDPWHRKRLLEEPEVGQALI